MNRGVALLWAAVLATATLLAPAPEAGAQPGPPTDRLPYGVPVPPDREVTRPPEPYNRARHGPPVANTRPGANLTGRPDVQLPERRRGPDRPRTGPPDPGSPAGVPGSGDRGFFIEDVDRVGLDFGGVHAQNDAQTDLVIPGSAVGTTIYAPTHMAAGRTCIETVAAHWFYSGMAGTAHGHGFWDWCESDGAGGWQVFESMDRAWQQAYVRRSGGEGRYWTEVHQDEGTACWWGMLYNFSLGRWEAKTHICGTNDFWYGWTMWESHHLMDQARVCPSFPDIAASDLLILVNGTWVGMSGSTTSQLGPYGLCWENGTYRFSASSGLDRWQALTSRLRR